MKKIHNLFEMSYLYDTLGTPHSSMHKTVGRMVDNYDKASPEIKEIYMSVFKLKSIQLNNFENEMRNKNLKNI